MNGKRLSDIKREQRAERKAAERFAEKHGVGALPGRRLRTGESAERLQVGHDSNETKSALFEPGAVPRKNRDTLSYDGHPGGVAGMEEHRARHGDMFEPIMGGMGGSPTLDTLEKRARMQHVLSFMDVVRVDLLYRRHVEGMTLEAIAREDARSRQSVMKRLRVAEQDFKREFGAHWNDTVLWEEV